MARLTRDEQQKRIAEKKAAREKINNPEFDTINNKDNTQTDMSEKTEPVVETSTPEPEVKIPKKEPVSNINSNIINEPLLQAKTTEKAYAKDNVNIIGNVPDSVPEDFIETPTIDLTAQDNEPQRPSFEPGEVRNPAWDDMSKKQQTMGSEYVAENIINGYVALNNLAKDYVSFDEQKYVQKAIKGEFDMQALDIELPISEAGQTVPVKELLANVNEMAERTFVVSDKFKDEVRPLLNSLCKEKGWGMSPGQQLLFIVGKDALPKAINIVQIKKTMDYFLGVSLQVLQQYKDYQNSQKTANIPKPDVKVEPVQPASEPEQEQTQEQTSGEVMYHDMNEIDLGKTKAETTKKTSAQTKTNNKKKTPVIAEKKEPGE